MEFDELIDYSGDVANSLICLSFLETKCLPTQSSAIESEFVNGTISYIGGNAGQLRFLKGVYGDRHYRSSVFKYFKKELDENEGKLGSKIKEALLYLLKPYLPQRSHYPITDLHIIVSHFPFIWGSTSEWIDPDRIEQVKTKTFPSFSEKERKNLEGIAKAMVPFIQEDVKYIKEHYSW